jgi:hypothetical protein
VTSVRGCARSGTSSSYVLSMVVVVRFIGVLLIFVLGCFPFLVQSSRHIFLPHLSSAFKIALQIDSISHLHILSRPTSNSGTKRSAGERAVTSLAGIKKCVCVEDFARARISLDAGDVLSRSWDRCWAELVTPPVIRKWQVEHRHELDVANESIWHFLV